MLILSREIGESFLIEDVVVTLVRVDGRYAEVALRKSSGGKPRLLTLRRDDLVTVCYDAQLVLVALSGSKARFGIESPDEIEVRRC